jgi:hypothetical protein
MPSLDTPAPTPMARSGTSISAGSEARIMDVPPVPYPSPYSVFDHRIPLDEPIVVAVSLTVTTQAVDTTE